MARFISHDMLRSCSLANLCSASAVAFGTRQATWVVFVFNLLSL